MTARILRILAWLVLSLASSPLPLAFPAVESSAARQLSLYEALRLAKERHVQVLVAQERVRQAIARIAQAKSGLYPRFDAATSQYRKTVNLEAFGIDPGTPGFDLTPPPFNVFDARLYLKQNLFDLTVLRRLGAARSGQRLSLAEQEKAEADALALVANLYLEAQRAQDAVEYVQYLQKRDGARLGIAASQKQLGLGSDYDVTGAKASFADSQNLVARARAEAEERRLDLVAALGLPPEQPLRFTTRDPWLAKAPPAETDLETLLAAHPDVAVAQRQVEAQVQQRRQEVAEYFPKIGASADIGASGPHPGNATDTYSFGGQLNIPIYQGGLRRARVQEASSKIRESEAQLEQTRRDKLADAKSALVSLRQAAETYRAAQATLAKAQQGLSLAKERLAIGVGSELEVIEAQADWASSKDHLSESLATYRLAWINLEYRLGRMIPWMEEIKGP
ncbi:MAG: TolC family protein [bacterium]